MKKLFLAGVVLAISASANAAFGVAEFPTSVLPDFLVPSVRGGDHGRDDRRYYDDDRRDRGRHRGHYKRRYERRERVDAPVPVVPVPVPPRLPAPPLPPGAPRPPGF